MQIPEINFSELELREIGLWPFILRMAVIVGAMIVTFCVAYFLLLSEQMQNLETQVKQEEDKRNEFKTKYNLAANLDAYRKQMVDIETSYKQVARELPSSSQVPQLVDTISQEAAINGLIADSIKPGDEKSISGFYKQLPLNLILSGSYNGIGGFVSDISKIPRIVTLHDFSVKRLSTQGTTAAKQNSSQVKDTSSRLTFTVEARTYWLSTEPDAGKAGKASTTNTNNPVSSGSTPPSGPNKPGAPMGPKGAATTSPGNGPNNVKGPGVPMKPGSAPPVSMEAQ